MVTEEGGFYPVEERRHFMHKVKPTSISQATQEWKALMWAEN